MASQAPPSDADRRVKTRTHVRKENEMNLYAIRRPSGWRTPKELKSAAARSKAVGENEMSDDIRWIRSYVVREPDGGFGTICIYQASSPEKIREHAELADLPADEVLEVVDTMFVRADPVLAAA
jgi:hypothetical protein